MWMEICVFCCHSAMHGVWIEVAVLAVMASTSSPAVSAGLAVSAPSSSPFDSSTSSLAVHNSAELQPPNALSASAVRVLGGECCRCNRDAV